MSKLKEPFVSIVTPVYNAEQYLAECIESVLKQTYTNWEYIILNNRSTDCSLEIAESYAQNESRIKVITNEQHISRMENCNRVFHYISSESKYCKVIHADDWIFPECLSRMVAVGERHPSVGIVGAYRLEETRVNLDGLPYPSFCVNGRDIARYYLLGGNHMFGSPTSLLIRSDFIRKREKFYEETTLFNDDTLASLRILQDADFGFVHQVLTFTRRHNETASSFIRRFETYRLGRLTELVTYGKIFLSNVEYNKRLRSFLSSYYRFLAHKLFELKEKEFWRLHREELGKLNIKLSYIQLFKAVLWEVLNMRDVLASIRRGFKNRKDSGRKPLYAKRSYPAVMGSSPHTNPMNQKETERVLNNKSVINE